LFWLWCRSCLPRQPLDFLRVAFSFARGILAIDVAGDNTGAATISGDVKRPRRKRTMLHIIITWLLILVAAFLLLRWMERRMLFIPDHVNYGEPSAAGLRHEEVWLTTSDGVKIHGWFVPAKDEPLVTCLFLHGNAGNITARLDKLRILHDLGISTLIMDYRGYGKSAGRPSETGIYRDADAAYAWLTKKKSVAAQTIVLFGESLGCAPALDLAVREPVGGVILESPFISTAAMGSEIFPWLPTRLIVSQKFDNLSKIPRLNAPLLVMHSRADEIIPFRHGEKLFAAANEPKRMLVMRGDHNGGFLQTGEEYALTIGRFASEIARRAATR
jgi:pimeloyl-ACP methyl ester carboxylesterase